MSKSLVIFDVDGTLTRTLKVDADCFVRALAGGFGISGINTDWSYYDNYTDSGIAAQIFREKLGHPPTPEEIACLVDRFIALLQEASSVQPELFQEIPGVAAALARLGTEGDWKIALATGCWLPSALYKLEHAGISVERIPLASADDSPIREEIVRLAISRSRRFYQTDRFERMVYVGDGVWDVKMSSELKIAFIGVADEEKRKLLRAEGARHFLTDFRDYSNFLKELSRAAVPAGR